MTFSVAVGVLLMNPMHSAAVHEPTGVSDAKLGSGVACDPSEQFFRAGLVGDPVDEHRIGDGFDVLVGDRFGAVVADFSTVHPHDAADLVPDGGVGVVINAVG